MSLSSIELNYLIWRYLEENGFGLAAYALEKDSRCTDYEAANSRLLPAINPGCLVNLVQKGILYTFLDTPRDQRAEKVLLVNAVLASNAEHEEATANGHVSTSEAGSNGTTKAADSAEAAATESAMDTDAPAETENQTSLDFITQSLTPRATFATSVAAAWHPALQVLISGHELSSAVIHALGDSGVAETVTLSHPPLIVAGSAVPNVISAVAWAPQGATVVTAGLSGEIRAWTLDGRLKNIVNSLTDGTRVPASLLSVLWNPRGSLVLTVDARQTITVWDGTSLSLVAELPGTDLPPGELHVCWVSELKFAVLTKRNGIRIMAVKNAFEPLAVVGLLAGHAHTITNLAFLPVLKLLALASDTDYAIKIWNSHLAQDALEVNLAEAETGAEGRRHCAPIVELKWLSRAGDVQGNELLSVLMEGTVTVWDAFTGELLLSANVFDNADNFRFGPDQTLTTRHSLVYGSSVSPDCCFLALGDDVGNVTVWDIQTPRYRGTRDLLRCVAVYGVDEQPDVGVSELAWAADNKSICVSYKGRDSVVLSFPGLPTTAH